MKVADGGGTDRHAEEILADLGDAPLADAIGSAEQGTHGLDSRPESTSNVGGQPSTVDPLALGTGESVLAVLGDVWSDRGNLDDLVAKRFGIVAGQRGATVSAGVGFEFDDVIGWKEWSRVLGVSMLTALGFAGWRLGWCGFDRRWVRGRRLGGVGRVLVESGFEVSEPGFEIANVRLNRRWQGVEDLRW